MTDNEVSHPHVDLPGPAAEAPGAGGELSAITWRVVAWYAVIGSTWIVLSDLAVGAARGDDASEQVADIGKGLLFVVVTALVLWVLLRRFTVSFDRQ
jgi:hypothetical protein